MPDQGLKHGCTYRPVIPSAARDLAVPVTPFRSRMPRTYYVYMLASRTRRLYIGVTNDLARRLEQHRTLHPTTFTGQYLITRLVHVELFATVADAIAREKQLKGWSRAKKLALIEAENPRWNDLTDHVRADRFLR